MIYGDTRRRIPELWDVDNPVMAGLVQNQDSYMQGVAAQRPFFFDHVRELADQAFREFHELTGRRYERVMTYRAEDADFLIVREPQVRCQRRHAVDSLDPVALDVFRHERGDRIGNVDDILGAIARGYPHLAENVAHARCGAAVDACA